MIKTVPVFLVSDEILKVKKYFLDNSEKYSTISYVYLVDKKRILKGVVSIKKILNAKKNIKLSDIMSQDLVYVHPENDRESVVVLALKNNIKAVPVLDANGKFLGVVPNDKILEIAYKEWHEDILKRSGVHQAEILVDNVMELSIAKLFRHRFPWLFVGLLGGIFSAQVVGFFEDTLQKNIILALFIPMIVYMADAVGTQMEAFMVRDLSLMPRMNFFRYFAKQFIVTFLIACITGGLLYLISMMLYKQSDLSFVLALSLILAICSSIITGCVVPYLFRKLKFDPANASGPIATIIQDISSVFIYFLVANWIL